MSSVLLRRLPRWLPLPASRPLAVERRRGRRVARRLRSPWGVRRSAVLSVSLGSAALVAAFATSAYLVVRSELVEQREQAALGQAYVDAAAVRDGLRTAGAQVGDVIAAASPPADADVLVVRGGEVYSSSLTRGLESVPGPVRAAAEGGGVARTWAQAPDGPVLAVGIALPAVDAQLYEVAHTEELETVLTTLRAVLGGCALAGAVGGALLGRWVAGALMRPLREVSTAAARIAGGELGTRVPATDDPDLVAIVASINSMVDVLEERISAEARFIADVSHELRSPLTTLVTSVDVLQRRRCELSERSQRALDLVGAELVRFRATLEDLLVLGRFDAGASAMVRVTTDAVVLVEQTLAATGRPASLLSVPIGAAGSSMVDVDRQMVSRALVNLLDNADLHGGGVTGVRVGASGAAVLVSVDDAGPGVPDGESGRIFERFARAGSRQSLPGSGLGLSLVDETLRAHGGAVWVERPTGGGARFVMRLPAGRA